MISLIVLFLCLASNAYAEKFQDILKLSNKELHSLKVSLSPNLFKFQGLTKQSLVDLLRPDLVPRSVSTKELFEIIQSDVKLSDLDKRALATVVARSSHLPGVKTDPLGELELEDGINRVADSKLSDFNPELLNAWDLVIDEHSSVALKKAYVNRYQHVARTKTEMGIDLINSHPNEMTLGLIIAALRSGNKFVPKEEILNSWSTFIPEMSRYSEHVMEVCRSKANQLNPAAKYGCYLASRKSDSLFLEVGKDEFDGRPPVDIYSNVWDELGKIVAAAVSSNDLTFLEFFLKERNIPSIAVSVAASQVMESETIVQLASRASPTLHIALVNGLYLIAMDLLGDYEDCKEELARLKQFKFFSPTYTAMLHSFPLHTMKMFSHYHKEISERSGDVSQDLKVNPSKSLRIWQLEIIRNGLSPINTRMNLWETILGDGEVSAWYLPMHFLGPFRGHSSLLELISHDKFPKIVEQALRHPFWKEVIALLLADWISQEESKKVSDHDTFEEFQSKALDILEGTLTVEKALETSKPASKAEAGQKPPRGLARVTRDMVLGSPKVFDSLPDMSVQIPWLSAIKDLIYDASLFSQIVYQLCKHRKGLGIAGMVVQLDSLNLNVGSFEPHRYEQIWATAFDRVQDGGEMDALLQNVRFEQFDTMTRINPSSPSWSRLGASIGVAKRDPQSRKALYEQVAEYIPTAPKSPQLLLGFLLLDAYESEKDYALRLQRLQSSYKNELLDGDREWKVIRNVFVERLYQIKSYGMGDELKDVNLFFARDTIVRAAKDKETMVPAAPIFVNFGLAEVNEDAEQWRTAFKLAEDLDILPEEKIKKMLDLFGTVKEDAWRTILKVPETEFDLDKYLRYVSGQPSFIPSAQAYAKVIAPSIRCDDKLPYIVMNLDHLAVGEVDCQKKLFDAVIQFFECLKQSSKEAPKDISSLAFLLEQLKLKNPDYEFKNKGLIAAALSTIVPEDEKVELVNEALKKKVKLGDFGNLTSSIAKVIETQSVQPQLDENQRVLVDKFKTLVPAQEVILLQKLVESDLFKAAFNLRLTMGHDKYEKAVQFMFHMRPKDSEERVEEFVRLLEMVMLDEEIINDAIRIATEEGKYLEYDTRGLEGRIFCNNLSYSVLLKRPELAQEIDRPCFESLEDAVKSMLLGTPAISAHLGAVFEKKDWADPSIIYNLSEEAIKALGKDMDVDNIQNPCKAFIDQNYMRYAHASGAIRHLSPTCITMAGNNWLWAALPHESFEHHERLSDVSSMLTEVHFTDIDPVLAKIVLSRVPDEFWTNFGKDVDKDSHPCKTIPLKLVPKAFWDKVSPTCLESTRVDGSKVFDHRK